MDVKVLYRCTVFYYQHQNEIYLNSPTPRESVIFGENR